MYIIPWPCMNAWHAANQNGFLVWFPVQGCTEQHACIQKQLILCIWIGYNKHCMVDQLIITLDHTLYPLFSMLKEDCNNSLS